MSERIIVVGKGAREHALAYRLERNDHNERDGARQVFVLGGNAGLAQEFECIPVGECDLSEALQQIKRVDPDLVVVGPESWLDCGLVDILQANKIPVFGPMKNAALLESSKSFMKDQCFKSHVRTAQFQRFNELNKAVTWLSSLDEGPLVIKLDGLCGGKGVEIAHSKAQALSHLNWLFNQGGLERLSVGRPDFIIEEFLLGREVSVFGVSDGKDVTLFAPLQDYKRLKDNDQGPNTGGMGAVAFLGVNSKERSQFLDVVKEEVFLPILRQMSSEGIPFKGLLYAGLMLVEEDINVLEFNVRFGDPETQALMMALKTDIYPLLHNVAHGESIHCEAWQNRLLDSEQAVTVVLASQGYPSQSYDPASIQLPKQLPGNTRIFFANTSFKDGCLQAENGRVMSVTSRAPTLEQARAHVYQVVKEIEFAGKQNRLDIGTNLSRLF